ncbi:MAG: bifunctional GNAT family N-acetyltransferase/(deoxy)nucleoside triphosphate pyrophosphohydrolase [Alphaproteobacteria bacterium]
MPTTAVESASPPALETPRLILRSLAPADAPEVQRLAGDWEVARYTANIPHPYEPGAAEAWIASGAAELAFVRAIERRADGAVIGCIGLTPDAERREGVLGYWIGRPFWGHGYATEAVRAVVDHGFAGLGLDRVRASAVAENRASIRILEKLGFAYVGREREPAPARGGATEVEVRVMTRAEWAEPAAESPVPLVLVAAVALVDADGRVLLARRPAGRSMAGLWEFPGGKVKHEETPESALVREIKEELGLEVPERCLAPLTFASHRYADFHLLMPLYVCRSWRGIVVPREGQELAWVRPAKLDEYPMPPADKPLIGALRGLL